MLAILSLRSAVGAGLVTVAGPADSRVAGISPPPSPRSITWSAK